MADARREEGTTAYRGEEVAEAKYVDDVTFDEPLIEDSAREPGSEAEGEPRRRRPRRRRRGRGGRKGDETSDREQRAPRDRERPTDDEPKSDTRRHAAPSDEDLDDEDDDDLDTNFLDDDEGEEGADGESGDDKESSGKAIPLSHRNIPTWEEAIGVIVDANRQTRSERKLSAPAVTRRPTTRRSPPRWSPEKEALKFYRATNSSQCFCTIGGRPAILPSFMC